MAKQFLLTSTNPCVLTLSESESNSLEDLIGCANRFAIGESNCDGCEHYYAITNRATGRSLILHSLDLTCLWSRKSPWYSIDGGLTKADHLSDEFLCYAAGELGCCVDELLYPYPEDHEEQL